MLRPKSNEDALRPENHDLHQVGVCAGSTTFYAQDCSNAKKAIDTFREGAFAMTESYTARRSGRWLRPLVHACAAAALILPAACSQDKQPDKPAGSGQAASTAPSELLVRAEAFRLLGTLAMLRGLGAYGTPEANLKFKALAGQFFTTPDWEANWQLFLSTAIPFAARTDQAAPLIGYYHPASDTMLLTGWQRQSDGWRIVSAEVLPGAVVRGEAQPWSLARKWQLRDSYPPEALAAQTTETARVFAKRFGGSEDPLAALDPRHREGLAALAAVPFEDFRVEVSPLYRADSPGAGMVALWGALREEATAGKTARTGDVAQTLKALGKITPKVRDSATPVAYLASDKAEVLMLASQIDPNLVIMVQATRTPQGPELRRLDLMKFSDFAAAGGDAQ